VLLSIAIIATLAAAGLAWYAWTLRRDERMRSEARVAALAGAIDALEAGPARPPKVGVHDLFASEHSEVAHGTPVIKIAVGVAMALILIVIVAMSNRGSAAPVSSAAAATEEHAGRPAAPLELLAMRHERTGDTLKVSGLVRNPRGGADITRVSAIVYAFNRAGAFVTSGRAALDFTTIAPGDESPFVVTIPGVADVGRYRVSFRTEAGAVQHVDRRAEQLRLTASERY
jgi:hypothetical protein